MVKFEMQKQYSNSEPLKLHLQASIELLIDNNVSSNIRD